jgi:hypothetical protein
MTKRYALLAALAAVTLCLAAIFVYNLTPIHQLLSWRFADLETHIRHALNPPAEVVFVPQEQPAEAPSTPAQLTTPSATPSPATTASPSPPGPTDTPMPSPTPYPGQVSLTGIVHEYQQMNNCGPTTLSMGLSFWGWSGNQTDTRAWLRPNFARVDDKNVDPSEMVTFVNTQTGLKALARVGGDIELTKRLVAAGFPVMIEKGLQPEPGDWMGHYVLVSGYDEARQRFITQDSYIMPDLPVSYTEVEDWWRDFNHAYLVIFPSEKEAEVLGILGAQADPAANYRYAAEKARREIDSLEGRELFFAWYNLGTNLVALADYVGAAQAYDQAFAIYPTIPEGDRPWRMLWYQVGPYLAYTHTGRYQDVIRLGNQTLDLAGNPVLEETFYWLGVAREATGDLEKALYDYQKAYEINPRSTPARQALERLGVQLP